VVFGECREYPTELRSEARQMKNKEYDVAVVGGGPNGLICSAYLARAGLSVIILERRHETGGGLDTLEFAGFKYNTHAIYHMMAEIMPPYKDFALKNKGVKFIFPEVQAAYITKDQTPIIFYKDPIKTSQYISSTFSSQDAERYTKMYRDFKEFSDKILIPLTYVPSMPPVDQVITLGNAEDDVGKRFNEMAESTPLDILDSYGFTDPVKAGILNLFTMWGLSPFDAIGYLFPLYVYRMTNAALCSGGSHRLSSALYKTFIEAGGKVLDRSEVVKVQMSNGKVKGVVLEDGTEIKAKVVASTVDPKQNFLRFFDGSEIPGHLVDSAKRWEWEKSSLFGVHLALKDPPGYIGSASVRDINRAMITFLGIRDTNSILEHIQDLENGKLPEVPYGHTTCTSLFDPIQAFKGFHTGRWESLVPFDCDWDNTKDHYAESCINEWKEYAPNLAPINILVYPPTYIEKKIKNMVKGSIKHGSYSPLQMGYFRPNESCSQVWTPINGFYVCGASVYPGGMILGGPGYIGANVIAEDLQVKKNWEEPDVVKKAKRMGIIAN
jgi:phytoene dehydrogenase-like protein